MKKSRLSIKDYFWILLGEISVEEIITNKKLQSQVEVVNRCLLNLKDK
jgi:hypothetical protein